MKLSECPAKSNNLQLLRFAAAILVIVSHSFSLSTGESTKEWLSLFTNGQISMGGLAVSVFFCAGGFLIAKSMLRVKDGLKYFQARVLRIFPSLIVVVLLTTFVLGPLVTEYSIGEYFKSVGVYKYLLNSILILQHDLPGVFTNNPSVATVNGSLWTLPIEFLCYIGCFVMWKLNLLKEETIRWSIPIVAVGTLGLYSVLRYLQIDVLISAIRPGLLFYMGILFYVYRDKIEFHKKGVICNLLVVVLCGVAGILDVGLVLCFPYLLLYVCFGIPQVPEKIGKLGNISYGIYLCGFPIQQFLVARSGGIMSPYVNVLLAIPLAILGGYLIYSLVEIPIICWEKNRKRA